MASRIKGITVEIGGDSSGLQKALKEVDGALSKTQSSLRDINKLLKLDPGNTDLLKQKQEALKDAISQTTNRLKVLNEAYQKLSTGEQTDKTAEQQRALQREIIETENKLKSLEKEYKNFGNVAGQKLQAVGTTIKGVGESIANVGTQMTTKVTLPLVAGFTLAANAASDYEENLNKIEVAFGKYADKVNDWIRENASLNYGLSQNEASESVAAFGALAKGIGFAEEEAAEMATTLTGLASDLGSYFNTDVEQSAAALEGIFTGNTTALKKFGVVMTDTNLKEFAQSLGVTAKQYAKLGQQEKTVLRLKYVLQATADANGDFAETSKGMANSLKQFRAALTNLAITIGQKLLPIITPAIKKFTEFIDKLSKADPKLVKLAVRFALVVASIGPALTIIGKLLVLIGSLVIGFGLMFTPIGKVVAVFTALSAIIALLVKNFSKFKPWVDKTNKAISDFINNTAAKVKKFFQDLPKIASEYMQRFVQKVREKVDSVRQSITWRFDSIKEDIRRKLALLPGVATDIFNKFGERIRNKIDSLRESIKWRFDALKESIVNRLKGLPSTASNLFSTFVTNIRTAISNIPTAVSDAFKSIPGIISGFLNSAKETISGWIEKIKGFFNFSWSLPSIKLPHLSWTTEPASGWVASILRALGLPAEVPKLHVDWYKKALENGIQFNNPTIFGMMNGKLLGAGEGGSETLIGTSTLKEMMANRGATINMVVNGGNVSAEELADIVIDKLTNQIKRNNQRW